MGTYESSAPGSVIVSTLIIIGILIAVFLIIRVLVLWYWKIDVIVRNQEDQIKNNEQWLRRNSRVNYYKFMALGNKEKAYEELLYIFYFDLTDVSIKDNDRKLRYETLKGKYSDLFNNLDRQFPEYPF
jgi:hypothetical protein